MKGFHFILLFYYTMMTLLGLLIMGGHIGGIVCLFQNEYKTKWFRIVCAIMQILMFIAVIGLTQD